MDVLISPSELADRLTDFRLLDVRWTVMAPDGRAAYLAGHLPGAVFVDLDVDLADHSVTGRGRHPLPTPQALAASARRWGLNDGDAVVVYDDWNGQAAARWWLLRAAGVSNVRILDGGWAAWQRSGGPVATGRWPPRRATSPSPRCTVLPPSTPMPLPLKPNHQTIWCSTHAPRPAIAVMKNHWTLVPGTSLVPCPRPPPRT